MLSDKVKKLIEKSRIVSFESWHNQYSPEVIRIFQQADDEGRYLNDEDIEQIKNLVPELSLSLEQGKLLRDSVNDIVNYARGKVLEAFPHITKPGGGLYPPMRAEACWRDFWHFLRCITYGISGQSVAYTSERGLAHMEQLYQELQVPLDAMILGLEQLKFHSLQKFNNPQQDNLAPYFDRLIAKMKQFSPVGK